MTYRCTNCGAEYDEDYSYCPKCDIGEVVYAKPKKRIGRKIIIALIAILVVSAMTYFESGGDGEIDIADIGKQIEESIDINKTEEIEVENPVIVIPDIENKTENYVENHTMEYYLADIFTGEKSNREVIVSGNLVDGKLEGPGVIHVKEDEMTYSGNFVDGQLDGIVHMTSNYEEMGMQFENGKITDTMLTALLSAENMLEMEGIELKPETIDAIEKFEINFSAAGLGIESIPKDYTIEDMTIEDLVSTQDNQGKIIRLENIEVENLWLNYPDEFWMANAIEIYDEDGNSIYMMVNNDLAVYFKAYEEGKKFTIDAMYINTVKDNYTGVNTVLMAVLDYKVQ